MPEEGAALDWLIIAAAPALPARALAAGADIRQHGMLHLTCMCGATTGTDGRPPAARRAGEGGTR